MKGLPTAIIDGKPLKGFVSDNQIYSFTAGAGTVGYPDVITFAPVPDLASLIFDITVSNLGANVSTDIQIRIDNKVFYYATLHNGSVSPSILVPSNSYIDIYLRTRNDDTQAWSATVAVNLYRFISTKDLGTGKAEKGPDNGAGVWP